MKHLLKEIEAFLNEAHNRFDSLKFKVGYGCFNTTYIIEVHPADEFRQNGEFAQIEMEFCDSFECSHPECTIIFVSDGDLFKVENPILQVGYYTPMWYAKFQYDLNNWKNNNTNNQYSLAA